MQVPSRKMIIAVIVDGHLFPELRHSNAKMCRRRTYLTTQRCKGCKDIIVNSLTTGVMRETRRSFQLFGTSRCASQKDTTRQKLLFTLFSGPFGRRKARFPRSWLRAVKSATFLPSPRWWIWMFFRLNLEHTFSLVSVKRGQTPIYFLNDCHR